MRDAGVGSVVVVDGTRRAIGILTERDLVRFAARRAATPATKVSEWMTEDPDTVGPDVPVGEAFARLSEHGYRHIPVVDDGDARRHRLDARPHARRRHRARHRTPATSRRPRAWPV